MRQFILALLILSGGLQALTSDLFSIKRNKNSNLVQYAVKFDDLCRPVQEQPVSVFWRMYEKGRDITESINFVEQYAYGIKARKFSGQY